MDPRLDPNVDPKRAKRILANRLSAARSKNKQRGHLESLENAKTLLTHQKQELLKEAAWLRVSTQTSASGTKHLPHTVLSCCWCSRRIELNLHCLARVAGGGAELGGRGRQAPGSPKSS